MSTDKLTFLFNWKNVAYHLPVYLAQSRGYFKEQGLQVALLSPQDPSDVTEIIGSGKIDMGAKAMIHTIAGKANGFPIKSVGTMMDEPFTGLIYLKESGISRFEDIKGRKIGYVGHFGLIQLNELTQYFGLTPNDFTAVRCGMNITQAIKEGTIDAGIGLENVQMVELEEWMKSQGKNPDDVKMLRIDELAELGCCCFCSILYIVNEKYLEKNPEKIRKFIVAVKKAADALIENPKQAWEEYKQFCPEMDTPIQEKIFERSFIYMSKDVANVPRDWTKVTNYCKRLGIVSNDFKPNYTNDFLSWSPDAEVADPDAKQKEVAAYQRQVATGQTSVLARVKDAQPILAAA
ncbi:uncharacterized protein I303_101455 [Kwoniella dejecticola CBS 10117]|uniref:4-amino-5-hydroxymethyl-2-methylpyrimidine phosphate synthase n=1 Tax=Kwoniella dejecticola CBS 10117 TaxID=1296121 RepID=A0A1A6AHS9_9TREE|nr:uncharacterized protein I303_01464 [Kwoniella dejecticola CBS 10117]OBR89635.1 hypothetical protein I303_01464 [Kwoniella dejecticola CBS 10117]